MNRKGRKKSREESARKESGGIRGRGRRRHGFDHPGGAKLESGTSASGGSGEPAPRTRTPGEPDRFLVGWHPVREALLARTRPIGRVLVSADRRDARIGEIVRLAREARVPLRRVPFETLKRLLPRGVPSQGIAAEVSPKGYADPDQLLARADSRSLFVVLDDVQDPHNLGAILRTAAAVAASALFVPTHRSALLTPTVARVSAGGLESVPVGRVESLPRLLEAMGRAGIVRVGLDPRANDLYTKIPGGGALALVMGGEERGLRPAVREACDLMVRIPIPGPVGSLNVSVAAGVALYEVLRARSLAAHLPDATLPGGSS